MVLPHARKGYCFISSCHLHYFCISIASASLWLIYTSSALFLSSCLWAKVASLISVWNGGSVCMCVCMHVTEGEQERERERERGAPKIR